MSQRIAWTVILALVYAVLVHFSLNYSSAVPEPGWWTSWARRNPSMPLDFSSIVHFGSLVVVATVTALISLAVLQAKIIIPSIIGGAIATYLLYRDALDQSAKALYLQISDARLPTEVPKALQAAGPDFLVVLLALPTAGLLMIVILKLTGDRSATGDR